MTGEELDGKEEGLGAVGTGEEWARYFAAVRTKQVEMACRRAGRRGKEVPSSLEAGALVEEVLLARHLATDVCCCKSSCN